MHPDGSGGASRVPGWMVSALGAAGAVVVVLLVASQVVEPELGEGAPVDPAVEVVELGRSCAEARRLFDELSDFAAGHRSCTVDADCVSVVHPVGCATVISAPHVEAFEATRARIEALQHAEPVSCDLPVARCRRSHLPVCAAGQCSIRERPWTPTDDR